MTQQVSVRVEATPNPNARKFTLDRELWPGRARTVNSPDEALGLPLAARLLAIPGVKSLFFLRDFITVTREPDADWEPITAAVHQAIGQSFQEEQGTA